MTEMVPQNVYSCLSLDLHKTCNGNCLAGSLTVLLSEKYFAIMSVDCMLAGYYYSAEIPIGVPFGLQ